MPQGWRWECGSSAGYDDFVILERADAIGGTWRDNRYPARRATCHLIYCFSFAPNPDWHHRFARQPEIEHYLARCVETSGLAPYRRLGTEVTGAEFDEARSWHITTTSGELWADVVIVGTGQLSRPFISALPGLDAFAGQRFHSARWDPAFDPTARRVAVIGSGASAIQIVPELATRAAHVTVLQRSPSWVVPRKDRGYRAWERWMFRHVPFLRRTYRALIFWSLEARL